MSSSTRILFAWLAGLAVALAARSLPADPPGAMYIFPAGGQRGVTTAVHVGGLCLHDGAPFEMLGPGVQTPSRVTLAKQTAWFEGPLVHLPESQQKEEYPRDYDLTVAIASDAPLGLRRWRVWNSQGATESMKFVVGDLPEILEREVDGEPIPTPVTVPVTINGRIFPREDVDVWTVTAKAGETFTCDVMATRLGSPLDARLDVFGPDGRRVAENADDRTTDPLVRFTAPVDGVYQIRIHDESYGGLQHYVYRLTITTGPYVDHVYPLGGRRGTKTRFLCSGQKTPATPVEFELPSVGDTHLLRLEASGAFSNLVSVELSDFEEHLESEPNDELSAAREGLPVPAVFNGRIAPSLSMGDIDAWPFTGKKGEPLTFDLRAARLGSSLDSVLTICDATGKQLAMNDDLAGNETDSKLVFTPPADGVYFAVVKDQFENRGGLAFGYRLVVSTPAARPDFQLRLAVDSLSVDRGGQAKLKVTAERQGGFTDAIPLTIDGLPAGVTIDNPTIPAKQNEVQLTLKAEAAAKLQGTKIRIQGASKLGDELVSRTAFKPRSTPDDLDVDQLLLVVAAPTPFKVKGVFETKFASRGSTYVRRYSIDRQGFAGPITIRLADRQARHLQGVTAPEVIVPADQSEFDFPIFLPSWMETGRTSRTCVMGIGELVEPDGSRHKVCYTSQDQADQVILIVDPAQMDVRLQPASVRIAPGKTSAIRVQVRRAAEISGPIRLELVVPEHIRGVSASAVEMRSDQQEATLSLQFSDQEIGPLNQPLLVRAITSVKGLRYASDTKLDLVK